ncbi:hypothetical protein [Achromobacter sp. HZ01]|uniref:hypothetical protein n=1 Tax=Achromobacter sp. HZ01 TaxID=1416886 RepID=UPI00143D4FCD|nr:hypothetical protein [Achromobacter sp. HZ01]
MVFLVVKNVQKPAQALRPRGGTMGPACADGPLAGGLAAEGERRAVELPGGALPSMT